MGGSCAIPISSLREKLSVDTRIVEVGYMSSEFRGGVTIDVIDNKQVPTFHQNFFEFVEKSQWEEGEPNFLRLNQITLGIQYYIFVTTQTGLYRYDINDLVEVTGHFNNTPTIQFVQKGKGVTNITGEKLCEAQLLSAIQEFRARGGLGGAGRSGSGPGPEVAGLPHRRGAGSAPRFRGKLRTYQCATAP